MRRNLISDSVWSIRSTKLNHVLHNKLAVLATLLMAMPLYVGAQCVADEVPAATAQLKTELANVRRELALLRAHAAPAVLANPSFENGQASGPEAWRVQPTAGAVAVIDANIAFEGQQSLHIKSPGQAESAGTVVALRSAPFQLPATRRVAVTGWMRTDPSMTPPTVWLVLEGKYKGQPFSHHVEVSGTSQSGGLAPLGGEWSPVTLQLDELPMDGGITDLVVGIDLRGAGDVWVDSVQLTDMWLSDVEQRSLMSQLDMAEAHLAAGRFEQTRQVVEVELPKTLAEFAPSDYLAPSLAQAVNAAEEAIKANEATQITVGRTVEVVAAPTQSVAPAASSVAASTGAASQQPITPIGADEQPVAKTPVATQGAVAAPAQVASRPTVLAANPTPMGASFPVTGSAAQTALETAPFVVSRRTMPASPASPATVATSAGNVAAAGVAPANSENATTDQPWWKFWQSDTDSTGSQVARTMPGANYRPRRTQPNAALAASPQATPNTVSLPQSAYRNLQQRMQGGEQTVAAAQPATATAESTDTGFFRRFRLPFAGADEESTSVAAQQAADNERRFSLFGLGRDENQAATEQVAGGTSATATSRDPFVVAGQPQVQPQVQNVPAEADVKESRFAALRKLFRTDDETATVTK